MAFQHGSCYELYGNLTLAFRSDHDNLHDVEWNTRIK